MKRSVEWSIVLLLCITAVFGGVVRAGQEALSQKLVRLHVIAASDSEEDQRVKLLVRDSVLNEFGEELSLCRSRPEAEALLKNHLTELETISSEVLCAEGHDDPVQVTLTEELYPTREYESFSLPAGEYLSLRIVLGEGGGHNWWCVVYPPLCAGGAIENASELTDGEIELITAGKKGAEVRFFFLDWISRLRILFEDNNL